MSWIFGFYSKSPTDTKRISEHHPQAIDSISNSSYYIAIGGNNRNLFSRIDQTGIIYFICGLPISKDASKFIDKDNLTKIFRNTPDDVNSLNGHFCGAFINNNIITLFTDSLGLREFHIYENDDGWYFSTRLDWILKLGSFEINFNEFSSRWLSINQLSSKSIIKKILRLNCGGKAIINQNHFELIENSLVLSIGKTLDVNEYKHKLEKLTLLGSNNNSKISLSLSGGMDSRVLLSFLVNSDYNNWNCHSIQTKDQMDSNIAEKMLTDFDIQHKLFSDHILKEKDILPELFEYVGATYFTESAFNSQKLMYYKLFPKEKIIIDGGFGEIWRREFLTRLYYFGRNVLL